MPGFRWTRLVTAVASLASVPVLAACETEASLPTETADTAGVGAVRPTVLPLEVTNISASPDWSYRLEEPGDTLGIPTTDSTQGFPTARPRREIRLSILAEPAATDSPALPGGLTFDVNQDVVVRVIPQEPFVRRFPKGRVAIDAPVVAVPRPFRVIVAADVRDGARTVRGRTDDRAGVPSFPGAEGFGAMALQPCRKLPVEVLRVTHPAATGPGTLEAALAKARSDRYTIIIFEVGGYIPLAGIVDVRNLHCVYVAGQTAPGDGVTVGGPGSDFRGIRIRGNGSARQVWRYIRFQGGSIPLGVQGVRDAIFDHLSFAWASEKAMVVSPSLPDSTVDITISRNIFAETLASHPTAMQITGQQRDAPSNARVSLLRNFFTGNSYRNPVLAAWRTLMLNNLIYNWNFAATKGPGNAAISEADVINNYYRPGPMTERRFVDAVVIECTREGNRNPAEPEISLHIAGNISPANRDPHATHVQQTTGPNRVAACYYRTGGVGGEHVPHSYQAWRSSRLPLPEVAPLELRTDLVPADVLEDVGANAGISCTGEWFPRQDAVDRRLILEYHAGAGIRQPPHVRGAHPTLASGTGCADGDRDGLPDAWEARFPVSTEPGSDTDGDGYLDIEEFLNGTDPTVRNH